MDAGAFTRFFRSILSFFSRARPPVLIPEARVYLDPETAPLLHRAPRHLGLETAPPPHFSLRHATAERGARADLTKERLIEEQRVRGAARVAELVQASVIRRRATQAAAARRGGDGSSSAEKPSPQRYPSEEALRPGTLWSRKRPKFYAVRRGRATGIFHSWEECERQTKGVASEFKSFVSRADAESYLRVFRRTNYMAFRKAKKPESSFVGGKALRAQIDVRWPRGLASHGVRARHHVRREFGRRRVAPQLSRHRSE